MISDGFEVLSTLHSFLISKMKKYIILKLQYKKGMDFTNFNAILIGGGSGLIFRARVGASYFGLRLILA
jgi:hypothetical protein